MALYKALGEYYINRQKPPELHICTDIRQDWIPPYYPDSNAPLVVRKIPDKKTAAGYWDKSINALLNGNYFDRRLAEIISCLTSKRRSVDLSIINGGKND